MLKKLKFNLYTINDFTNLPKTSHFAYNYLIGIAMLYLALSILSGLTVYKLVKFGAILLPAGIFTTPLTYCLSNVITEVYGYAIARNLTWWFIFCSAVFTIFAYVLIHLPSPPTFKDQAAYELLLGSMPRIYIAGILGTLIGMSLNNYLVSKFKIYMNGKHYWFRSILSTCSGEIIYNLIAYPIMLLFKLSFSELMHVIMYASFFKFLTTSIFLMPECMLARYLKINEKINIFDHHVDYNFLKFKINNETGKTNLKIIKV